MHVLWFRFTHRFVIFFQYSFSLFFIFDHFCCPVFKFIIQSSATSSVILIFLPGESPCTKEPSGLQSMGLQRVGYG